MNPHRTDPVSLVAGLACLGVAGLWLIAFLVPLHIATVGGIAVGGLLLVGSLGLVYAITSSRRPR